MNDKNNEHGQEDVQHPYLPSASPTPDTAGPFVSRRGFLGFAAAPTFRLTLTDRSRHQNPEMAFLIGR